MSWHFYQRSKCKNYIESLKYPCIRLTQVIKSKVIQSIRMSLLDSQSTSTSYHCLYGSEYSKSSCRYSFVNSHMCIGWNPVITYPLVYFPKSNEHYLKESLPQSKSSNNLKMKNIILKQFILKILIQFIVNFLINTVFKLL